MVGMSEGPGTGGRCIPSLMFVARYAPGGGGRAQVLEKNGAKSRNRYGRFDLIFLGQFPAQSIGKMEGKERRKER